jgi:hypothetical protein
LDPCDQQGAVWLDFRFIGNTATVQTKSIDSLAVCIGNLILGSSGSSGAITMEGNIGNPMERTIQLELSVSNNDPLRSKNRRLKR